MGFKNRKLGMTMQKIILKEQFEQDWIRMFTHLANLFFEQSEICTHTEEDAITVDFSLKKDAEGLLIGEAFLAWNGKEYVATFTEQEETGDAKMINRQLKRVYSHIFLEVLEQATGMQQSWGILTGIRPTKLYHKYRQDN